MIAVAPVPITLTQARQVVQIASARWLGQRARRVRCVRRSRGSFVCSWVAVGLPAGHVERVSCAPACVSRTRVVGVRVMALPHRHFLAEPDGHRWAVSIRLRYPRDGRGVASGTG